MMKDFNLKTTVFYKLIDKTLKQKIHLHVKEVSAKERDDISLVIYDEGVEKKFDFSLKDAKSDFFEFYLSPVESNRKIVAELLSGNIKLKKEIVLKPRRKWEIHVQNFTHTDIGFTDLPSRVVRGYQEAAKSIIDFCRQTANFDEGSKYKWNVETGYWLENALKGMDKNELHEFRELVKSGFIEITPLYVAHTSEFNDEETLIRSMYFAFRFAKECGVKIETAMASDVTGQPWILPQILLKSGIRYFSTAVNSTMAKAPKLERPFYWQAADGSKIMLLDTDERQAYQEGIMIGLHEDYETVYKKLPMYLEDLEDTGNFNFDLIALRAPGYPGDNTKPNIVVSQIVQEWNREWVFPKLIISTYSDYFKKFEKIYGDKLKTYSEAWPDWWVNYHGAVSFETGVNRITHTDISNAERFSTLLYINDRKEYKYPKPEIDYVYDKLLLADEADWAAYTSSSEPDCLQSKGQKYEIASFVYQAAIDAKELSDNSRVSLSKMLKSGKGSGIIVSNPLGYKRSEIAEVVIPKTAMKGKEGFKIIDSITGKEVKSQFMEQELHDFQTASLRIAFFAEDIPPLGFKVFDFIADDSEKKYITKKSMAGDLIENDFYAIRLNPDSGEIMAIIDKAIKEDIVDSGSEYRFNQFVYDADENERLVDLSNHEISEKDILFLQPYYRKLHADFYDSPTEKVKFKRYFAENSRIAEIREGSLFTEIITTSSSYMFPQIKTRIMIDNINKRIIFRNYLSKYENLNMESLYFMFPFNAVKPSMKINIHGGFFEPENEQLPGSAKDWYCVQKWINIADGNRSFLFSPLEAPLVQLGGINTGKYLDNIKIDNGTVASFVMNNHWWTNSPASQCGRFEFSYFVSSSSSEFDPVRSGRFGWSSHFPLIADFINREGGNGKYESYSLMEEELPENVILTGLKKAEDGKGVIFRFLETSGKSCCFDFSLNGRKIKEAFLTDPVEKKLKVLDIEKGKIKISQLPFELSSIYIATD